MTTGIQFENNGNIRFTTRETFERLDAGFSIRPGITIQARDYTFRQHSLLDPDRSKPDDQRRRERQLGEFWDGDVTSFSGGISLKPSFRWNVDFRYAQNSVRLPDRRFTTDLVGVRFVYGFNPNAFFNAFVQYNTAIQSVRTFDSTGRTAP